LSAERTHAGRVSDKQKGVRFDRPPKLTKEQITLGQRLIAEGTSVRETTQILNCHHATLYRAIKGDVVGDDGLR
jgi:DNA invertase Pin-like site-specific DNA recombinase